MNRLQRQGWSSRRGVIVSVADRQLTDLRVYASASRFKGTRLLAAMAGLQHAKAILATSGQDWAGGETTGFAHSQSDIFS